MNKTIKHILFLALTFPFLILSAKAQEGTFYTVNDLEVWSAAKLKYSINEDWRIGLEQQYRLKDDASTFGKYITELDIKLNLGENLSASLGTRFIRDKYAKGDVQGVDNLFRWNADLNYKHQLNRFSLKYRFRYQAENELSVDDESDKTIRFKIGTDYNIKKSRFTPEFSTELFNELNDSEGFTKVRFTLGTEYKIKHLGKIGAFYRVEKELDGLYPKTTNIIGISYQYTIKNNKK
jgi:hypothetical protein